MNSGLKLSKHSGNKYLFFSQSIQKKLVTHFQDTNHTKMDGTAVTRARSNHIFTHDMIAKRGDHSKPSIKFHSTHNAE